MSVTGFGILSVFDHNVQSWETYKGHINQWYVANDITEVSDPTGIKRRAILLSALADGTHKLAVDLALPKQLQDVPYEDILRLLDEHFTPKRCGFGERFKFYAATQQEGETYAQWAARLRGLTAHCGFSNVEEALRDKFVMGMLPGADREKLFSKDLAGLTLTKAMELAENARRAREAAGAGQQAAPRDQLFKIARTKESATSSHREAASGSGVKVQCQVCGYHNHETSQCRFAKAKCRKCNATGHLRRMCKNINYVESKAVDESDDDGECFNIRSVKGEPMIETVLVSGIELKFEIDSGSAVTAISKETYETYFSNVPLLMTSKRLFSYTGDKIVCEGIVQLQVSYANTSHVLSVYVVRDGGPPILGRDFISKFKLEMLPIQYCDRVDENDWFLTLQGRYPAVFSDKLGLFNKFKVKLHLKEDAKPVFIRARPLAFALKNKVDNEIDRLVRLGVLKPVDHARYASPIVPVLKQNGTIRICADFSTGVNKQLMIDQYPLPTVTELFSKLYGGQQFTKLDLSSAYNQFMLDDESQELTCINTHRGLFKQTRLCFGIASAPAVFQRAMEGVLAGVPGTLCMLDDILITGETRSEHLSRLHQVLAKLQDAGLTLQKEKCMFFKDEVNYLGYVINKDGLHKSPQKIKAMIEAPVPSNINQLQSFLGLVNYYRNFVPNASSILSPMYELLKKSSRWCWTQKHDEAFTAIKSCLASDQVLAHFNPEATIILTVDASPVGLSAILSQVETDRSERPISFASRTLNAAEKRYSQIQKEATAIIFGVRRFHQYLYGRSVPFILRTDHKPLLSIFGPHRGIPEVSANRLQRYALFLSGYNYQIEYVRSANNSADFLSRACLPEGAGTDRDMRGVDTTLPDLDRASYINFVLEGSLPVTLKTLRDATGTDSTLRKVIDFVLNGWPRKMSDEGVKPFHACRTQLSYENGCIMRGHKVVIPEKLRTKILMELHQSHLGIVKTKAEARARVWFPGIDAALERLIGSCDVCMQSRPSPARAPIAHWEYPPTPFYRIHIDFLGPISGSTFLVVVDAYSKWVEVYNMKCNTSTSATIDKLYEFMSRFGIPHTLVSDNGTSFKSHDFEAFCRVNGISHVTSPTYHAASNGQAESYVKIIKKGIKTSLLSGNSARNLNNNLLKFLFDYRNSVHTLTGLSPAELVYGRKLRTRFDLLKPEPPSPSSTAHANMVKRKQCLQNKTGGHNTQVFAPGDIVYYKNHKVNGKFTWCKGTVMKKVGRVLYVIKDKVTSNIVRKHKNQIIKYKGDDCYDGRDLELDIDEESGGSTTETLVPEHGPPSGTGEGNEDSIVATNNSPQARAVTPPGTARVVVSRPTTPYQAGEEEEYQEALDGSFSTENPGGVPLQQQDGEPVRTPRSKRNRPKVNYKLFY
ncbi:uncharacterized protein K02A2.6-like [Spodoptera litura]|uniref:RNA-directed DNA polymerase n=1 Tax=Spodoptera litura TaxID=69820 RepID=A0A9J7DTG2_SPOLT|nr:uncharacterized protein K02A2.6-like [Spodoptera litura]